jgi:hypothetical protein
MAEPEALWLPAPQRCRTVIEFLKTVYVCVHDHVHVNVHEIPRIRGVTAQAPNNAPHDESGSFVYVDVDVLVLVDMDGFSNQ